MIGKVNTLPNYIEAKSAKRLRSLMYKNNLRLRMSYVHYSIIHDGKKFYAWYDEPLEKITLDKNADNN